VETEANVELAQLDAVQWLRALPSDSIDLLVTDPPYESLEKHRAVGTTTRLKVSAGSSNPWFTVFPNARFPDLFAEVYRVLKRNSHFYLMCDQETAFIAKPLAESAGFKFWKPLIWDKCLAPDTPVWTTLGVRRASEIVAGDRVATPDGRDVAVLAVRTTRSPALRLALSDGTTLICAADHRLLAADGRELEARLFTPGMGLAEAPLELRYRSNTVSLEHLVEDSAPKRLHRWLSQGRLPADWAKELGISELSPSNAQLPPQNDPSLWFPESIPLDYGLGKVLGLFAAGGTRSDTSVVFTLHDNDEQLRDHVARQARSLGLNANIEPQGAHGCTVSVHSKFFSNLVSAFVGGSDATSKFLTPRALSANPEFSRGIFDGLIESDGHWSHEEQRETYASASLDLACYVLRFTRGLGYEASMRRFEHESRGGWKVRFDPASKKKPLQIVSLESAGELDLIDIAIDDPGQLYVLGNGAVSHNCTIGMGYHYRARYEFVLFFEKGKRKLNDLGIADVLTVPRVRGGYPAEKPSALSETLILQSSAAGDIVADPFMGSGSVGAAALKLSRRFLGNDVSDSAMAHSRARFAQLGGQEGVVLSGAASAQRRLSLVLP